MYTHKKKYIEANWITVTRKSLQRGQYTKTQHQVTLENTKRSETPASDQSHT